MSRSRHHRPRPGNADTRTDATTERRTVERAALHRLLGDPEAEVLLPTQRRHTGDPWRWD